MYLNFNLVILLKNDVFSFTFFSTSTAASLGMQKCSAGDVSVTQSLTPWPSQSTLNGCQWRNWRKWLPLGRQKFIWCILGKNRIEENEENDFLLNIADIIFIRSHESLLYDLIDTFLKNWNIESS